MCKKKVSGGVRRVLVHTVPLYLFVCVCAFYCVWVRIFVGETGVEAQMRR